MSELLHHLEADWRHVTAHLHHHPATITVDVPPPTSGAPMALADTSASLTTTSANLRSSLENGASALREALDNHMAQLDTAIGDVAAVADIADHPLVVSAARLVTETAGVPAPIVDGFVAGLEAIARAFPKQAGVPAEPAAEAAPEAPAEAQPEQPAEAAA